MFGPRSSSQRHADDQRGGGKLKTDAAGRAVTGVVVEHDGRRKLTLRHHRGVARARPTRPSRRCGQQMIITSTGWPIVPPGRTELHVPQQPGGARPVEGAEPDRVREDLGVNDSTQGPGFRSPMGNIQMIGKSAAEMSGAEIHRDEVAPDWAARRRHPCGGFLAVHREFSAPGEPCDVAEDGRVRLATRRAIRPPRRGCTTSSSRCWAACACTRSTCSRVRDLKSDYPGRLGRPPAGTCLFGFILTASVSTPCCGADEPQHLCCRCSFFPSIGGVNRR